MERKRIKMTENVTKAQFTTSAILVVLFSLVLIFFTIVLVKVNSVNEKTGRFSINSLLVFLWLAVLSKYIFILFMICLICVRCNNWLIAFNLGICHRRQPYRLSEQNL